MRSGVTVIDPTLISQRSDQLPPVTNVQAGVTKQASTTQPPSDRDRRIDVEAFELIGGMLIGRAFCVRRALRVFDQFRLWWIGRIGRDD